MNETNVVRHGTVRAVANLAEGSILASVELPCRPERVFRALASEDITGWWARPGVFDTRVWTGELRVGGAWRASGVGVSGPYTLEGEFLEVDSPTTLAHTWRLAGVPGKSTTVRYVLDPIPGGTRLTVRHTGFAAPQACESTAAGWETSLVRLAEALSAERTLGVE